MAFVGQIVGTKSRRGCLGVFRTERSIFIGDVTVGLGPSDPYNNRVDQEEVPPFVGFILDLIQLCYTLDLVIQA